MKKRLHYPIIFVWTLQILLGVSVTVTYGEDSDDRKLCVEVKNESWKPEGQPKTRPELSQICESEAKGHIHIPYGLPVNGKDHIICCDGSVLTHDEDTKKIIIKKDEKAGCELVHVEVEGDNALSCPTNKVLIDSYKSLNGDGVRKQGQDGTETAGSGGVTLTSITTLICCNAKDKGKDEEGDGTPEPKPKKGGPETSSSTDGTNRPDPEPTPSVSGSGPSLDGLKESFAEVKVKPLEGQFASILNPINDLKMDILGNTCEVFLPKPESSTPNGNDDDPDTPSGCPPSSMTYKVHYDDSTICCKRPQFLPHCKLIVRIHPNPDCDGEEGYNKLGWASISTQAAEVQQCCQSSCSVRPPAEGDTCLKGDRLVLSGAKVKVPSQEHKVASQPQPESKSKLSGSTPPIPFPIPTMGKKVEPDLDLNPPGSICCSADMLDSLENPEGCILETQSSSETIPGCNATLNLFQVGQYSNPSKDQTMTYCCPPVQPGSSIDPETLNLIDESETLHPFEKQYQDILNMFAEHGIDAKILGSPLEWTLPFLGPIFRPEREDLMSEDPLADHNNGRTTKWGRHPGTNNKAHGVPLVKFSMPIALENMLARIRAAIVGVVRNSPNQNVVVFALKALLATLHAVLTGPPSTMKDAAVRELVYLSGSGQDPNPSPTITQKNNEPEELPSAEIEDDESPSESKGSVNVNTVKNPRHRRKSYAGPRSTRRHRKKKNVRLLERVPVSNPID